jgi:hypothetical protein
VTATDLALAPSDYLQEIDDSLQRAEKAYAAGDLKGAGCFAEEGLAAVRLAQTRLGPDAVPPHYPAFFRCLRIQTEFRQALALFKQGLLCQQRHPGCGGAEAEASFRKAWQIFGPAAADVEADLGPETLVYHYPIAGRVLRGVARLRDQLRARVQAPRAAEVPPPPRGEPPAPQRPQRRQR